MAKIKISTKNGSFIGEKIEINNDEIILKNPLYIISSGDNQEPAIFDFKKEEKFKDDLIFHIIKSEVIWYYETEE